MRIEIACFTGRGRELGRRLEQGLSKAGDQAALTRCGGGGNMTVRQWAAERFHQAEALVFIGAVGIAVRAVAPMLVSKTSDPAVVAVDDCGRFSVALLSGHIGGANELAQRIAHMLGCTPVVTTATDVRGVFAVDVWARREGLVIANPERIKCVSAKLLAGETVRLWSWFPISGELPVGVESKGGASAKTRLGEGDIIVDIHNAPIPGALHLIPPVAVLGVGCRKGTAEESIENAFQAFCADSELYPQAFGGVCSIDLKKDEPGLAAFCSSRALPFETFSAETLAGVEGGFSASDFVTAVTGVDNVCERSAVAGSGGGELIVKKTVYDGVVTMAAAVRGYAVDIGSRHGSWPMTRSAHG